MSSRLRVPFVPTPEPVVRRMLTLANVKPGELLYDLGDGNGRILSLAARDFDAKAVGVELHPHVTRQSLNAPFLSGLETP